MNNQIVFESSMAKKIGVTNAIILSEIIFIQDKENEYSNDGQLISMTSSIDLSKRLEFFSLRTIQRSLSYLINNGFIALIKSDRYVNDGYLINQEKIHHILNDKVSY